jgi:hypothetical protein
MNISAFPCAFNANVDTEQHFGMTLRDYFAAQALGILATHFSLDDVHNLADGILGGNKVAQAAFALADAMLKARAS